MRRMVDAKWVLVGACAVIASLPVTATAQTDVMNIINDKVGVGTAAPVAKFHVVDPADATYGGYFTSQQNGANPVFALVSEPATAAAFDNPYFAVRHKNGAGTVKETARLFFGIQDVASGSEDTDFRLDLMGGGTVNEVMRIKGQTGRVGIGTSTPLGRLDVNGSIYQRGVLVHADYVFDPSYELESIDDHADFMWTNRHLPAVPPRTVDENGFEVVEVGSQRRGILEELEKAHIYIEQLHSRLENKESQVKTLSDRVAALEQMVEHLVVQD